MKRNIFLLLSCCIALFTTAQTASSPRQKYNFNNNWKVFVGDDSLASTLNYNDTKWKTVTVPYAWNEDAAFKVSIEDLPTGIAWYRKHFSLPKEQKGKKVFIEFEGIRQAGEFYLNGKFIGLHENGITAFGFDITHEILFGEDNVIAVRIDNSWNYHEKATKSGFQWNDKNFNANYGGITKNVFLHVTNPLYQTLPLYTNLQTTGVYVYAKEINVAKQSAFITAESEIKNEYITAQTFQLKVSIEDAVTGKKIITNFPTTTVTLKAGETQKVNCAVTVNSLQFWSWGYGYLYNVYTTIVMNNKVVDEVKTTTGFRKTAFTHGTLFLNNRAIQVKGYAQRSSNEWPAVGNCVPAWLSDYSNGLMVKSNANLVRWMHITPSKQDVESCDRVGLMQAMPAGDSEKDVDGRRWQQRKEVMRDAIVYNRNNPSIIFYECGNNQISEEHMKEMKTIRDTYDAYGGRAIGSRNMLDSKEAEYGGEMLYINKSASKPMWQMEYSRDEGLRKYWDEFSPPYHKEGDGPLHKGENASAYNHNQDAHAIENVVRWFEYWEQRPGTGNRVNGGGVNIIFSESNTHHRGAENYRRSGEVDAMRIIKDGFYAHEVMWDGWVNNEKPLIHLLGHWNYKDGVVKNMYVVANTEKVELFVNGQSLGFGERSNQFLFTFKNVTWKSGNVTAIGYDKNNQQVCKDVHTTAGNPFAVRMKAIENHTTILANGADLALVEFEVVDDKGNRCPTALNEINFDVKGEGIWRGGIAQGKDNYILSTTLPVECGVNRFFIRSTTKAGSIIITAKADGLQTATLQLQSKSVIVSNGLTTALPNEGLKCSLDKGPTPLSSSIIVTRKPLQIVDIIAGAKQEKAKDSYDDNEASAWSNDGKLNTAWIEYDLGEPSVINQVVLKLNNFRTKTYPVRISVDGQKVFEGVTSKSLGYVTLSFAPKSGRRVKVEMTSASTVYEDKTKEVNNQKLGDGVDGNATEKGSFSIIEAEIYGPVN